MAAALSGRGPLVAGAGVPWMAAGEFALVAIIYTADQRGIIPVSKTPFLLILGWISLRLRGLGWRDVGLSGPGNWPLVLGAGAAAGIVLELISTFVTVPLLSRRVGQPPDLSDFRLMVGNAGMVLALTLPNWILAALGEEMVYRGYLMNRVADVGRRTRAAWGISLVAVSALFGAGHLYQGATGMIQESLAGAALGGIYLAARRNLWTGIVAHGIANQLAFLLIYLDRYPGV